MTTDVQEKPVQDWEKFSSPGHVLLAHVDVFRIASHKPKRIGIFATGLVLASFVIAPLFGQMAGSSLAFVTEKLTSLSLWGLLAVPVAGIGAGVGTLMLASKTKLSGKLVAALAVIAGVVAGVGVGQLVTKVAKPPREHAMSPAPAVRAIAPVLQPGLQFDMAGIPSVGDIAPELEAQAANLQSGKRMTAEECNLSAQINQSWFDGSPNAKPNCRYSKDGERLWIWSYVKQGQYHGPFLGLIAKRDGQVTYSNVEMRGMMKIPGKSAIDILNIPRTIAADFPELI